MALDTFGNYVCDISPPAAPYPGSPRCCLHGDGPPDNSIGTDGKTYVDDQNSTIYFKAGGVWYVQASSTAEVQVFIDYAPLTPPTNPNLPALSFPAGGGTLSQWTPATQSWG